MTQHGSYAEQVGYPSPLPAQSQQQACLGSQGMCAPVAAAQMAKMQSPIPTLAAECSLPIEEQLVRYLSASLRNETMISESVVHKLLSSVGSNPLNLKAACADDLPVLHLVVLNDYTPAPAMEHIIAELIQFGASPEEEDDDGDTALTTLVALALEEQQDGNTLSDATLDAHLGAIATLLGSRTLQVGQKLAEEICRWLRHFARGKRTPQRVLEALANHIGSEKLTSIWCSEQLLAYLDSEAYDAKRPVEARRVLDFLKQGASPGHSQNGATALIMIILNPRNSYEDLLLIFEAILEREPSCAAIRDGFGLYPLQWAADYHNVSSQHNLAPNPASFLALLPNLVEKVPVEIDAGEVCVDVKETAGNRLQRVKPNRQLRFKEGDAVLCRVQIPGGDRVWEEGVVTDVWYREDCWPDQHPGAPYEVLLDIGTRVFALVDHDRIIRRMTGARTEPAASTAKGKGEARFQRRKKDDGSWELLDTKSGNARPIAPPDSDSE